MRKYLIFHIVRISGHNLLLNGDLWLPRMAAPTLQSFLETCTERSYNRLRDQLKAGAIMSDENQVEEANEDSLADALSAVALVTIAVVIATYWVSNQ